MTTVQAMFVPLQEPLQPLKTKPASGVWRTVSTEFFGTVQWQLPLVVVEGGGVMSDLQSIGPLSLPSWLWTFPPLPSESNGALTESVVVSLPEGLLKFAVTT